MVTQALITFLLGAMPVSEINGAIIYGLAVGFSPIQAFFIGFIGNILPILPLYYFLQLCHDIFIKKESVFAKAVHWFLYRARRHHETYIDRWGKLWLLFFVALPFPLTGIWTATAAAFIFGFSKKETFWLLSIGTIIDGIFMLLFGKALIHSGFF